MLQFSHFPHLKTSFFVINRNNHHHQYIPIHNLYKSSFQVVENQLLISSALIIIIYLFSLFLIFLSKPYLTRLLLPIYQSKTRISSFPMRVHQIQVFACPKGSAQNKSSRKRKPRVLRQKLCGVSPMKCEYCLVM